MKRTTADLREGKPSREEFLALPRTPISLLMTGLKMENLGSVFRVADSARLERILLCDVPYTPESLRFRKAAKGSHRWVPHAAAGPLIPALEQVRAAGTSIVVLEQTHDSVPYTQAQYRFPACLVLGHEKFGVDEAALAFADLKVEIPMRGMANSLNVAVAAGILIYEMFNFWERSGHV
jgi:23S rRNA (guanosine2251-2'-O)-methyltransferase